MYQPEASRQLKRYPDGSLEPEAYHTYIPDRGCEYFDACLSCPLVECYMMYPTNGRGTAIKSAIQASWQAGIDDPSFYPLFTRFATTKELAQLEAA